jgi:hypothetical protein
MNSHVTFLGLVTGMVLAWPSFATPPATQVLMDSGSPYYVPAAATVTTGGAIRWDNPTPTRAPDRLNTRPRTRPNTVNENVIRSDRTVSPPTNSNPCRRANRENPR